MTQGFIDVWINCPDRDTAEAIARSCVEERLAACANIFAPISSVYWWNGSIEAADEVPVALKTREALFDRLCARVRPLHPYDTPSIVAMPLTRIDPAYAAWLEEETKDV